MDRIKGYRIYLYTYISVYVFFGTWPNQISGPLGDLQCVVQFWRVEILFCKRVHRARHYHYNIRIDYLPSKSSSGNPLTTGRTRAADTVGPNNWMTGGSSWKSSSAVALGSGCAWRTERAGSGGGGETAGWRGGKDRERRKIDVFKTRERARSPKGWQSSTIRNERAKATAANYVLATALEMILHFVIFPE